MGNGRYVRCAFIDAELAGYRESLKLIGAYQNRRAAVRKANKEIAGLLWIGQSPVEMLLVVR